MKIKESIASLPADSTPIGELIAKLTDIRQFYGSHFANGLTATAEDSRIQIFGTREENKEEKRQRIQPAIDQLKREIEQMQLEKERAERLTYEPRERQLELLTKELNDDGPESNRPV